jgi:type I restriction enzyme M protein
MDQKVAFADIRNFLAGRMLGATRDQSLLEEVMKCLLAYKAIARLGATAPSDDLKLAAAYRDALRDVHVPFAETDQLLLDPASVRFVHDRFRKLDLFGSDRDPVGDLYETFIGSAIRGSEGQFFTPLNAVEWLASAVGLRSGEAVIDPACGAGGFLMAAAKIANGLDLFGIEKDAYLADLARARMQVLDFKHEVFCANSLSLKHNGAGSLRHLLGQFDLVLANPPFGKNIKSVDPSEQREFALGHRWKKGQGGELVQTPLLLPSVPPQVLFLERIMTLLREGGRAGIVVPESLLCGKSYAPVVQYLRKNASIKAVVGMPEALFKHSGKGGTHTKTCLLVFTKGKRSSKVYMAEAAWCGHDSRGRKIDRDDLPAIAAEYARFGRADAAELRIGYEVSPKDILNNILAPRYHEPTAQKVAGHLVDTHELVKVADLLASGELQVAAGNEVGKLAYGGGSIPFVRTSDLSGWEIKADPKHLVSEEVYERLKVTQDVRAGDVLMVRDGTYLIGTCAFVTKHDEKIVYQSHILKFRCKPGSRVTPHLLLALLSCDPVQQQIKAKTFTQDIINSLGNRVGEVILPVPRSRLVREEIDRVVKKVIDDRIEARELSRVARRIVVDPEFLSESPARPAQNILQLA